MPTVYRFRVTFEEYDEVIRDVEIKSTQNFDDLHNIIQSSIGFDASKHASFYMSNDNWLKEQEISSEEKKDKDGKKVPLMKDSRLCDFIADPHQKIYYISDFDSKWTFFVELFKILPAADVNIIYPLCVKSIGEAPKQYTITSVPKSIVAEETEFDALLATLDDDEDDVEEESLVETETGVDEEEIEGMSEEGESDSTEESDEEEMSMSDDEEQHDEE